MYVFKDEATTVVVPLLDNGESFIPTPTSVSYRMLDQDGSESIPATPITTESTTVQLSINLTSDKLTVGSEVDFEKRTLIITGVNSRNNLPFRIVKYLTVIPIFNYTVSNNDVRNFIGVDIGELPDNYIDLTQAYFDVVEQCLKVDNITGKTKFLEALSSGTNTERQANYAILCQSVINIQQILYNRLSIKESDGPTSIEREKVSVDEVIRRAYEGLISSRDLITGTTSVINEILTVTNPSDPINGGTNAATLSTT